MALEPPFTPDPDYGKWPNVEGRQRVSLTHDACKRLDYVVNNMDLECMATAEIELMLPIFHRRPPLQRMLLAFRCNCVLTARFDHLGMDVEYVEREGYFQILNVWCSRPKGRFSCRIPNVPIPWHTIPPCQPHIV